MQERCPAWEIFQRNGRRLPMSAFRKDRRVVHAVPAGRPCDFLVIAKVPGHEREFTVEVFIPPEAATKRERELELEEAQPLVVQGTVLQRYKAENDEDANEIRQYIAEVDARTDLSEDEKDDEIGEWETILGKRRMDRMRKYFQIGITEGL